jgi:hypothetical protein
MTVNPASTLEFKREVDIKVSFRVETPSVGSLVRTRRHARAVVNKLMVDKTFVDKISGPPSSKVKDLGWRIEAQVE